MPEPDGFLRRWSRLKTQEPAEPEPTPPEPPEEPAPPEAEEQPALPPIEELGPDSDYTVFLKKNVPAALRAAALRKAWSSNPAITGHKPLVEYAWDYNAPGFGALNVTDDPLLIMARLRDQLRQGMADADAREAALSEAQERDENEAEPEEPRSA